MVSPERRHEILASLRRGTVPQRALDAFAVGLDAFQAALDEELASVSRGGGVFKAVRGEYGSGKTFLARWFQERARQEGFAAAEVQISETETPLHRLETVYRRLIERLSTADTLQGAFRNIIDAWFYALEEDVLSDGEIDESDSAALLAATERLMERRLAEVTRRAPTFAAALRGYRRALAQDDLAAAEGLLAWLSGQPNVAASVKRFAGIKGDVDHFGALSFLQGLLAILRDAGHPGLVWVLDEVETLQRMRSDVRDKSLNALRQLIDEIDGGRFPGLYLMITGTTAFYDGPMGVARLAPLAQRLAVHFDDPRWDNPRAVQVRLHGFNLEKLVAVGRRIRDIYADGSPHGQRIGQKVDDALIFRLAEAVTGGLGGKVGVAPRLFLKKLVGEVLDRVEQFPDFDPAEHYHLTLNDTEMNDAERVAVTDPDDIELSL
ncbi:MAG: BREX system ATP-binding protein BrxD [Acidobacteriota bacterium]|nr:BREX system ATP-binding protein BrxD [Acidobacteriota bacterium]